MTFVEKEDEWIKKIITIEKDKQKLKMNYTYMVGIFIYIHQGMHQNKMNGVILKRNLKHYLKTYKN
jgi:hypothetical protein